MYNKKELLKEFQRAIEVLQEAEAILRDEQSGDNIDLSEDDRATLQEMIDHIKAADSKDTK